MSKTLPPLPEGSFQKEKGVKASTSEALVSQAEVQKKLEAQRKQARTFAKQQQMAERLAVATEELSSSVAESTAAVAGIEGSLLSVWYCKPLLVEREAECCEPAQ